MTTGVVELSGVTKAFPTAKGEFVAVDNISLATRPGEFLTLLGPSGCGKTTTLRMIAGFETPNVGNITLDGQDMIKLTPDKRPMSMVFQSYALFPHLSVFDNVAYGLKLSRIRKDLLQERVESALASMDLVALARRAPNQLSGGQQQRVALARAMVMRPKVLLFDEPLSNLDAKLRVQMRTEIRRLQQRLGITALYVTHDQDEAMSLSDRIVVMNRGRIEQIGTPDEIYRRPASVFVADFIGSANFLATDVTSFNGDRAKVSVLGQDREVGAAPGTSSRKDHLLLVRPESVSVTPIEDETDEISGNNGRIISAVFYGSVIEYEVETDAGSIVAVISDPDEKDILRPGALVKVDFSADRGWLLAAQGD